jgi:hypothetical protein
MTNKDIYIVAHSVNMMHRSISVGCHYQGTPSQRISGNGFAPSNISHMKWFALELDNYAYMSNPFLSTF